MQFHKRSYKPMDYKSLANLGTDLTTFQAKQLQGLNEQISVGAGSPELVTLGRDIWETIPKPHFKEMQRLSNLTGVEPSIHAPMIDTIGIAQGFYSEEARKAEERLIEDVVDKAHMMAPKRNVIVNIHAEATGKSPTIWRKHLKEQTSPEARNRLAYTMFGKTESRLSASERAEFEKELQKELTFGVDRESGQLVPLKFDIKRYPPTSEDIAKGYKYHEEVWTPQKTMESVNETQWMGEVEGLHQHEFRLREVEDRIRAGEGTVGLKGYQDTLIHHARNEINSLFNKMQQYSPYEERNWKKLSPGERAKLIGEKKKYDKFKEKAFKDVSEAREVAEALAKKEVAAIKAGIEHEAQRAMQLRSEAVRKEIEGWSNFFSGTVERFTPERIVPLEEFAIEKAAKTFAEAAEHSLFKTAKGKLNEAPIISVENPPAMQFGLSRADEIAELVKKSRDEAVELFKKKHKMSESAARHAAKKLIGATWDVGHINQLRQGGYDEKDIVAETKKIAPFVKHLHLTDNFGTADSHLPPGMGNVPIEKMQKELGKAGFKGKSVLEVGGFISHFKTSPWPYVLDSMDSPVYEFDAAPTWKPSFYSYFFGSAEYPVGYGNIFPPQHFSMYGAGFALPPALGAELPGEKKAGERAEFGGAPIS